MDYLLVIRCKNKELANRVIKGLFNVGKRYDVEKELEARKFDYSFYPINTDLAELKLNDNCVVYVVSDETNKAAKSKEPPKKEVKSEFKYHEGMPIRKFLIENPKARTLETVRKYYPEEVITRALQSGVFFVQHGKIKV